MDEIKDALTQAVVDRFNELGESQTLVAKKYGIDRPALNRIINGHPTRVVMVSALMYMLVAMGGSIDLQIKDGKLV